MIKQLHIISQYLAAAGISFLEKKPDDSHYNLGWDSALQWLITNPFGKNNIQIAIGYKNFSLIILEDGKISGERTLNGKIHQENLVWIEAELRRLGMEEQYHYNFHYDIGYGSLSNEYMFSISSLDELEGIANRMNVAQKTFETFLNANELKSPIRVWPHHFDLGIYAQLDDSLYMGGGLAIPDTIENDQYYYATGWLNGSAMDVKEFSELPVGRWGTNGFKGASYASTGVIEDRALLFLNSAVDRFKKSAH